MRVLYGLPGCYKDITDIITRTPSYHIPVNDNIRASLFGDPLYGTVKHVRIEDDKGTVAVLSASEQLILQKDNDGLYDITLPFELAQRLKKVHATLQLKHGSLQDEYSEQLMAIRYIQPSDRVLEIGGHVGRNSCVIGRLLTDSRNLVVMEISPTFAQQLKENRDANGLQFQIETAALSRQRLIQMQDFNSTANFAKPHPAEDALPAGWIDVATTTWDQLRAKYALDFNVLVADCEGALYYIQQEEPAFFTNFKTVIMENDYFEDFSHKQAVDRALLNAGFTRVYVEAGGRGPCRDFFYEVWSYNMK